MSQTTLVPVSDPAHPSHQSWLEILLLSLKAAITIGPAIVQIVDPGDAKEAQQVAQVADAVVSGIPDGGQS